MNKIFMRAYQNAHQLTSAEVLDMFTAPDGVLHGIQRDTIGVDETGNIIPGNEYFSAIKQCGCKTISCIVHIDNNEHHMQILMSHTIN